MASNVVPISVLMPVFNAEAYLAEAIDSILNQTFKNFEFLIIDDGSSDRSRDVIRSFDDERIRCLSNRDNLGLISTLNEGLKNVKGKYIARMDADDIAKSNRLELQFDFMEKHFEVGVCGTWYRDFGRKEGIIQDYYSGHLLKAGLIFGPTIGHPTAFIRVSTLKAHNLSYDRQFLHVEDYKLWYDLSKVSNIAVIPSVLLHHRVHQNNVSKLHSKTQQDNRGMLNQIILNETLKIQKADPVIFNYKLTNNVDLQKFRYRLNEIIVQNKLHNYYEIGSLNYFIFMKWVVCLIRSGMYLHLFSWPKNINPLSAILFWLRYRLVKRFLLSVFFSNYSLI